MRHTSEVAQQLRLLGELRDLPERWLDLAGPGQSNIGQMQELLPDIQRARNEPLAASMATAHIIATQHLASGRALLGASIDVLRAITEPFSPLNALTRDFLRRAEISCAPPG